MLRPLRAPRICLGARQVNAARVMVQTIPKLAVQLGECRGWACSPPTQACIPSDIPEHKQTLTHSGGVKVCLSKARTQPAALRSA